MAVGDEFGKMSNKISAILEPESLAVGVVVKCQHNAVAGEEIISVPSPLRS